MAEASELSKIDLTLRSTGLFISDLEGVAALWNTWSEDVQADYTLEWMGVMDHLTYVTDQVEAGAATPEQIVAYRRIQDDLRAGADILRMLEWYVPPEILREVAAPPVGRVSA